MCAAGRAAFLVYIAGVCLFGRGRHQEATGTDTWQASTQSINRARWQAQLRDLSVSITRRRPSCTRAEAAGCRGHSPTKRFNTAAEALRFAMDADAVGCASRRDARGE